MAKEYAESFYNGRAWIKCRDSYIAKRISIDGGMCEECQKTLGYIVHHKEHITPKNIKDVYITLSHENLEYVCIECHNNIHMSKHTWGKFDRNGQPLPESAETI